ncbi:MAG TPA: hypothetical protein VFV86_00195 [Nitrososphaeraceae archaeon]|nr:hypothetical protein [Nitrososphaeraceae archaeon]
MSSSIDWSELIKDKKGVISKDNQSCGNIIGEEKENILVEDGAISQHFYRLPKSSVEGYNGAQITLNLQYNELSKYEDRAKDKGTLESIADSIEDTVKSVKDNTVDKVTNSND